VKRLAASIVVAGRHNGSTALENRQSVISSLQQYHTLMQHMASMCALDIWYQHINIEQIIGLVKRKEQERLQRQEKKASRSTNLRAFPKMAEKVNGLYRIKDEPPLIVHVADQGDVEKTQEHEHEWIKNYFAAYIETLPDDRKVLLRKYHFVDVARKVVGVGSVGTRTWVGLFMAGGDGDDPLFLQVKEADASVLEPYFGQSVYTNHGERVAQGQRLMPRSERYLPGLDAW
jgi:uncharacterized protein (DUF2252 family)